MLRKTARAVTAAALLAALGTGAAAFEVRPGATSPEMTENPSTKTVYRYEMISVVDGTPGNRFLIERRLDRKWDGNFYWQEWFTIVTPEANRRGLADHLNKAEYNSVTITDDGVQFLIESMFDGAGRLLKADESFKITKTYAPHDCDRVVGECAFTVLEAGKPPLYLLRTSRFEDGIWTDVERHDPARDPGRSDAVRDERRFSVDRGGVLFDMQTTRHTGQQVEVFQMTRLSPGLEPPPPAAEAPKPELPDGVGNNIGQTCEEASIDVSSGEQTWTMAPGDKQAFAGPSRQWKIRCGTGAIGTSCPAGSHARVIYDSGWVMFGCYDGAIPSDPFAG